MISSSSQPPWWQSFEARLLLGALLLRLLYLSTILDNPYFNQPITDEALYDMWGQTIAAGEPFIDYPYYDSPLHAFFLGSLYTLFGHDLLMVRLIQIGFGTANVVLIYRIAHRLFDPPTAKVAGILAATYLPFLYYEGLLLKESFALFLLNLALLLFLIALTRPTYLAFWSVGLVVGVLALSRVNALALVPACLIAAWLPGGTSKITPPRTALLALLLGVVMAIAPATIRNWLVSGEWIPITVSGGQVLYTANNPANTTGDLAPVPFVRATSAFERVDFHRQAETENGRRMTPAEVSSYWWEKSIEFSLEQPATQARMIAHRFLRFWNYQELPDNHSFDQFKRFSWLLHVPLPGYWLVAPFALLGLILLCARWRELGLLYLMLGFYLLSLLPFWIASRYRLPIIGVLILFAAPAIMQIACAARGGEPRRLLRPGWGLVAAAAFCWIPLNAPLGTDLERNLAYAYEQEGRYEEAFAIYEQLQQAQHNPENDLYLANALGLGGRTDEALALLGRLSAPQQPSEIRQRAFNFRGDLARRNKDWAAAEEAYRAALAIAQTDYGAWNNLAIALINQERFDEAKQALQRSINLAPEDALARLNLEALQRYLANTNGTLPP